jgi:hypothetical protein
VKEKISDGALLIDLLLQTGSIAFSREEPVRIISYISIGSGKFLRETWPWGLISTSRASA